MNKPLKLMLAAVIVVSVFIAAQQGPAGASDPRGSGTITAQPVAPAGGFSAKGTPISGKSAGVAQTLQVGESCWFYNDYLHDNRFHPVYYIEWCALGSNVTHFNPHFCYNGGTATGWNYNLCQSQPAAYQSVNQPSAAFYDGFNYNCCGPFPYYSQTPYVFGRVYPGGWIVGQWNFQTI